MNDFDPTQNRVPTCLLTADELAALRAAKHGWIRLSIYGDWHNDAAPAWQNNHTYRANPPPPPPTLSITVNGVTNVVAAPVVQELRDGDRYWYAAPHYKNWMCDAFWGGNPTADAHRLSRDLIHKSEAAARAHAMAMVGLKAEGV